jgi:hypothetical protein
LITLPGGQNLDCPAIFSANVCAVPQENIMNWIGEYLIDSSGQCRWHEGFRIQDERMKAAYRKNVLVEFIIETSATMGVKAGMA